MTTYEEDLSTDSKYTKHGKELFLGTKALSAGDIVTFTFPGGNCPGPLTYLHVGFSATVTATVELYFNEIGIYLPLVKSQADTDFWVKETRIPTISATKIRITIAAAGATATLVAETEVGPK